MAWLPRAAAHVSPTAEELAERFIEVPANEAEQQSIAVARRIMARDANGDTYLAREELPERMQGLMRADGNRDGLLSTTEVIAFVNRSAPTQPRFAPPPPVRAATSLYDVVNDLRLSSAKHDSVMQVLRKNPLIDRSDALARLRQVLDGEEYGNFVAATTRISAGIP